MHKTSASLFMKSGYAVYIYFGVRDIRRRHSSRPIVYYSLLFIKYRPLKQQSLRDVVFGPFLKGVQVVLRDQWARLRRNPILY